MYNKQNYDSFTRRQADFIFKQQSLNFHTLVHIAIWLTAQPYFWFIPPEFDSDTTVYVSFHWLPFICMQMQELLQSCFAFHCIPEYQFLSLKKYKCTRKKQKIRVFTVLPLMSTFLFTQKTFSTQFFTEPFFHSVKNIYSK